MLSPTRGGMTELCLNLSDLIKFCPLKLTVKFLCSFGSVAVSMAVFARLCIHKLLFIYLCLWGTKSDMCL